MNAKDRPSGGRPSGDGRPAGFLYSPMFPLGADKTPWKKLPIEGVRTSRATARRCCGSRRRR
jgi:fumarate hydratase class I